MDRIFFENIRCFATRQEVPLAPLTVLVGENSTGKSTVLALVRLAWDLARSLETPDFNEEPFLLGAYEQIVSKKRGAKAQGEFLIGACHAFKSVKGERMVEVSGKFSARGGQPILNSWRAKSSRHQLTVPFRGEERPPFEIEGPSGHELLAVREFVGRELSAISSYLLVFKRLISGESDSESQVKWGDAQEIGGLLFELNRSLGTRPYSSAPIRTRPQRTYDPIKGPERPEGSHVPMILASAPLREPARWKDLFSRLDEFGRHSGLFSKVKVRRLGHGEGDPFQIQVHIGGNAVNLIDVGYGVSQVLPIVVDCLRGDEGGTFLLQQPEVHLHPRAQAELGSFLGTLAKQQKKRFVIETHSDYLVDRIRMDIRDGKGLRPEDVSLLYFERKNGQANIHRLTLDEHGNLLAPPPGYRDFFMEEARRFLGG